MASALHQRKSAVIEYRPALINGEHEWYWSVLPLPDEAKAIAHGSATNRGKAAMQARQQARRNGYSITSVRIKHAFAEAAARRISGLMSLREARKKKPVTPPPTDPDAIDPKAALNALPARYWLVSIEAVNEQEVIDYYVIAFDEKDAVERLRKRGVLRPEPTDYVAAVIEVPKSDYDQFLKWQEEFGVYESVSSEAAKAETPTEDQAKAGNYRKGHVSIFGLDISIENAKGSKRTGTNKQGKKWSVTMPAHYGYICGTKGKDKDHIDVYIGPDEKSEKVFVVNQKKEEGSFDEHKCMICFDDRKSAIATYDKAFTGNLGPKLRGSVVTTTMDKFKEWLKSEETKKPFKSIAEALLEADPDEINAYDYISHIYDWLKFLGKNNFELFNWNGSGPKQYAKYIGDYMVLVADWNRDNGTIDIQFFQSTGKAWAFIDDEQVPPSMVELTVKKLIKRAEQAEMTESGPDDLNPKQMLADIPVRYFLFEYDDGERVFHTYGKGFDVEHALQNMLEREIIWLADVEYLSPGVEISAEEYKRHCPLESVDPDAINPKDYLEKLPKIQRCPYCRGTELSPENQAGYVYCFGCDKEFRPSIWNKVFESDPDAINPKDYLLNTGPFGISKGEHGWHLTFDGEPIEWLPDEKNASFYAVHGNELHKTKPFKGGLDTAINWYWREKYGKEYYKGRSTDPRWNRRLKLRRPNSLREAGPDDIDPRHYISTAFDWREALLKKGFTLESSGAYALTLGDWMITVWPSINDRDKVSDLGPHIMLHKREYGGWVNMPEYQKRVGTAGVEPEVDRLMKALSETVDPDTQQTAVDESGPDEVDPKEYLNRVQLQCRYAFDVDLPGDEGYTGSADLPLYPPPGTQFDDVIEDPLWQEDFMNKLRQTEIDPDDLPWIVEIRYRGNASHMESEDPDAVDAKAFLNRTFPTRGTIKDFTWALDAKGFRGVGIRKQEGGWKVYGHFFGSARAAKAALAQVLEDFKLLNIPWTLESESPTSVVTRMFHTLIPLHLLDGAGHEDVSYPPGYLIRT